MAYNVIKGNIFGGGASPPDGYVVTWSGADGYYIAKAGPSGSFAAGGDLTGSSTNQTVIRIQNKLISSVSPNDGDVLTWDQADGYWIGRPTTSGPPTGSAGGDLGSTYPNPTVVKIQTRSINNVAPPDGYVLTWDQANNYWTPKAGTGGSPTGSAGGDLGSTYPNPTVTKIQTHPVNAVAPTDGYVLTWDQVDGYWVPRPATSSSPTGAAGGDLSGTYPNPVVAKLQTNPVNNTVLGATQDGYVLTWINGSTQWQAQPVATQFLAGGDLTGTATNQNVINIHGASVPIAGSLVTGNVLQVSGTSALSYGPVNLAGGANYVINSLPTANQVAQSLSGDLSGTTAAASVIKLQSYPVNAVAPTDGYVLTWDQTDGYWLPKSPAETVAEGIVWQFANIVSDIATYLTLQDHAVSSEADVTATVNSGSGQVLIQAFATSLGSPNLVLIPKGIWEFKFYRFVDAGSATFIINVYTRTAGGSETLLFSAPGAFMTDTSVALETISYNYINDTVVNPTDRIVIKILATTVSISNRTVHFVFDGATHASRVHTPIIGGTLLVGGDLTGNTNNATVTKLQTRPVNAVAPTDGYVLTWDNPDGYWVPRMPASGSPTGPAGGDLGNTYPNPTVVKLNTHPVNSVAPTDGYVLTWDQADGYWLPKPATGGTSFTAGGDLSGTNSVQTVIKINGTSVPATPAANQVLVATSGTTSVWSTIYDGYVSATAAIAGTKISPDFGAQNITTTGAINSGTVTTTSLVSSLVTLSGKFLVNGITTSVLSGSGQGAIYFDTSTNKFLVSENGGAYSNLVTNINGNFGSTNITTTGSINAGATVVTSLTASLETLSGKLIVQGIPTSGVLSNSGEGVIYFDSGVNRFKVSQNGSSYVNLLTDGYAAGGDLSGTYPNPTVAKINGTSVSATPSANQVLVAISGSASTWAQIVDGYVSASAAIAGTKISPNFGSQTVVTTGKFEAGAQASSTLTAFGGTWPLSTTAFWAYNTGTNTTSEVVSGLASGIATTEVMNTSGGNGNTVMARLIAAGSTFSGITAYQNNSILEQFGPTGSSLIFASYDGAGAGGLLTGRIYRSGAWGIGDTATNNTSSAAQAGLTGSLINLSAVTGGALTSAANQSLLYNSAGVATLQGHAGSNFITNTTLIASTNTAKFITNAGRRRQTTLTTNNLTIVDGYDIILVGTLSGSITVTLPASPTTGDTYTIKDQNGSAMVNNIIVSGNGNNIDGTATSTINANYGSMTVIFGNSRWGII